MEIGGQRAGRQRFKVHHQPGIMMRRDRGGEPLGQLAGGGRIGEQAGGAGAVPAMGVEILDHRQQLGRSAHAGDHLVQARVGMELRRGVAARHGYEGGHDPVELTDMTAQRGDAAFVIGDIEADIERTGLRNMAGPARQPFGQVMAQPRHAGQMRGAWLGQRQRQIAFRRNGDQRRRKGNGGGDDGAQQGGEGAPRPDAAPAGGIEENGSGHGLWSARRYSSATMTRQ